MFDDRRDVLDPGDANLNKPPPELEDPAQREQWAADERAAREEARAPYLADTKPAVERTRFATTGRTQLEEVTGRLKAFDPARVYGVDRVPDRYDLKRNNENKARVEWEIAHAPGAAGSSECTWPPSTAPTTGRCGASPSRRCWTRTWPARSWPAPASSPRPRAHPRRRARRDRLPRPRGVRGRPRPLARLPGRGPARPPRSPQRASGRRSTPSTARRRRSSPRSSTCSTRSIRWHGFPQLFNRRQRPQLGARTAGSPKTDRHHHWVLLRLADPDERYAAVRLCSTCRLPAQDFARHNGDWRLELDLPDVMRLEYKLEVVARRRRHASASSTPATRTARAGRVRRQVGARAAGLRAARRGSTRDGVAGQTRRSSRSAGAGSARRSTSASGAPPTPSPDGRCRCCSPTTGRSTTRWPRSRASPPR